MSDTFWNELNNQNQSFINNNGVTGEFGSINNTPNMNMGSIWDMDSNAIGQSMGTGIQTNPILDMNKMLEVTPNQNSFWSMDNPDAWKAGAMGIGAVGALTNSYLGFKQLGQAEDQLAFQKEAFWKNYNQQLEDRKLAAERRRIASNTKSSI